MKLLLVEDELELANFLIRGLKYEGYSIDHVNNGLEAEECLQKKKYDLVILDLILPSISGEKILENMRLNKDITPVIVLTAVNDIDVKTNLLNMGADDYLIKPFSFVELIARIKSIHRRSQGVKQQTQEVKVGKLVLSPAMRMAYKNGKPIKLRLKEYALLEYFMQNPDKVINRSTLIEKIWDYNAKLFSNTVDSHISLLRKKINTENKEPIIETVHGIGYIMRSDAI